MKMPDLPRETMRWDNYKAFHWGFNGLIPSTSTYDGVSAFVAFDTGELIVNHTAQLHEQRRRETLFGIKVWGTRDEGCPRLFHQGAPVPPAWLNEWGMQALLVDEDLGRAYGLTPTFDCDRLPGRFTHLRGGRLKAECQAYYPGPGREPVTGKIVLYVPFTNKQFITDEEREHIKTQTDLCRAMLQMDGKAPRHWNTPCPFEAVTAVTSWEDLDEGQIRALYYGKIARKRVEVPWLSLI